MQNKSSTVTGQGNAPAITPKRYKAQYFDTDCECWTDDEDIQESSRWNVEDDVKAAKRRCAYPVRYRIVEVTP